MMPSFPQRAADFRGPWQPGGVILCSQPPIAAGAGHCAVLQLPGDRHFIFYHRRPIPNHSPNHRVCCVEPLHFSPDGWILPVNLSRLAAHAFPLR